MNWRQTFTMGIISSLLSSLACIIYMYIYNEAFLVNFSKIVSIASIISSCVIGCFLMTLVYKFTVSLIGKKSIGWLNIGYAIISFASITGILNFDLPLETESPEMFPGLVIPMHFFPSLSIFTIYPFFEKSIE